MGFWARLLGREGKMSSLELFRLLGGGRESKAGVTVTVQTALDVATVLSCCRIIAEGVAQVPFKVYRETPGGNIAATDHKLYRLLYRRPNPWQTSFEFRETMMFHTVLCGNAFVFVNRVGIAREIRELILIEPKRVTVKQLADNSLEYTVRADSGEARTFGQDAIWHVRGPSWNTWMGLEATMLARNAIGLAISLEQGQSEFQKNGATMTGIVSVKDKLDKTQFELLSNWIERHRIGGDRSHMPLIVDRDGKFLPTAMTGVDAQLLETRKHQIEEICRQFRVMPIMVGQSDKAATYASAEQMFLAHVVHTLSPWYQRIEQSADVNLLSEADQDAGLNTRFTPNALMRGAAKDRAEYYAKALGSGGAKGWMTQNDVRRFEEMPLSTEAEADVLPQQNNSKDTSTPPPQPE